LGLPSAVNANNLPAMNISPRDLRDRIAQGKTFRLIDVREADEWAFNRIPEAELIPLSEFQQRAPKEPRHALRPGAGISESAGL
jgi:rhodanese-related sulfurtransferase